MKLRILREIGFVTNEDNVYMVQALAHFYNETAAAHGNQLVDLAVDEFVKSYDPSKRITSKLKYFQGAINRLIKNLQKDFINDPISEWDGYRYYDYELEYDLTLLFEGVKLTKEAWLYLRNKHNEETLVQIKSKFSYTEEQINAIRQRWLKLDAEDPNNRGIFNDTE